MSRITTVLLAGVVAASLGACKSPMHLSYDYGRAFNTSFASQADLTRPSVASSQHALAGYEATMIRLNSLQEAADKETATSELTLD